MRTHTYIIHIYIYVCKYDHKFSNVHILNWHVSIYMYQYIYIYVCKHMVCHESCSKAESAWSTTPPRVDVSSFDAWRRPSGSHTTIIFWDTAVSLVNVCKYTHIYVYIYIELYTCIVIYIYIYVYMCIYIYVYVYIIVYIYIQYHLYGICIFLCGIWGLTSNKILWAVNLVTLGSDLVLSRSTEARFCGSWSAGKLFRTRVYQLGVLPKSWVHLVFKWYPQLNSLGVY